MTTLAYEVTAREHFRDELEALRRAGIFKEERFIHSPQAAGIRVEFPQGAELKQELQSRGIRVRAGSTSGLAEEAPLAYKPIEEVIEVVTGAGIARAVARLEPMAVIKG